MVWIFINIKRQTKADHCNSMNQEINSVSTWFDDRKLVGAWSWHGQGHGCHPCMDSGILLGPFQLRLCCDFVSDNTGVADRHMGFLIIQEILFAPVQNENHTVQQVNKMKISNFPFPPFFQIVINLFERKLFRISLLSIVLCILRAWT